MTNTSTEYNALVQAAREIEQLKIQISREDGAGYISPAWSKLHRVQKHITAQADLLLNPVEPK